jgi:hypothetical protein
VPALVMVLVLVACEHRPDSDAAEPCRGSPFPDSDLDLSCFGRRGCSSDLISAGCLQILAADGGVKPGVMLSCSFLLLHLLWVWCVGAANPWFGLVQVFVTPLGGDGRRFRRGMVEGGDKCLGLVLLLLRLLAACQTAARLLVVIALAAVAAAR